MKEEGFIYQPRHHLGLVEQRVMDLGRNVGILNSSCEQQITQSIHPPGPFGSSSNLGALAIEANGDDDLKSNRNFIGRMHEIAFSTNDKPKLLSRMLSNDLQEHMENEHLISKRILQDDAL